MPRTKRPKPLYQRGHFALYRRPDRTNLEIVWYDAERQRERSVSAGTGDVRSGKQALDRRYLEAMGNHRCPTCGREMEGEAAPLLTTAILDYLTLSEGKAGHKSARTRLAHVIGYVASTNPSITVPMVSSDWVAKFRTWMDRKGAAPGHVEGCVLQLAAAINRLPGHTAQFKARSVKEAAVSPVFRASVEQIAAMFRFCIDPPPPAHRPWSAKERAMVVASRENLLRYLRAAVATWARPDAIFDLKAKGQWHSVAGVLDLNQPTRRQTKKYRPTIPVAHQFAPWLDEALTRDSYIPVSTVRHGWASMHRALGLPGGREAGEKLIRRSMATICRKLIGEANWTQGELMLGHRKTTISDLYAIPDPANLGLALAATESVIDHIERLTPGAFCRKFTAEASPLRVVEGGR
jgi:hypothetical protein